VARVTEEPEDLDEVPVSEIAEEIAEEEGRRYPSTIGGFFYLWVLAAAALGVAWAWIGDDWRVSVRWIAASLLAAATLRLLLPTKDAGMLAVPHRLLDVLTLGSIGGVLMFLAQTIPDQPMP
jgi:hypothetical protein